MTTVCWLIVAVSWPGFPFRFSKPAASVQIPDVSKHVDVNLMEDAILIGRHGRCQSCWSRGGLDHAEHLILPARPVPGPDVVELALVTKLAGAVDHRATGAAQGHGVVAANPELERAVTVLAQCVGGAGRDGGAGRKGEGLVVAGTLVVVEDVPGEADIGVTGVGERDPVLAVAAVGRAFVGNGGEPDRLGGRQAAVVDDR